LTQREEDNRVRRGKDAAKGATVIFWRLAGGEEEELLALRVLLLEFVAIFSFFLFGEMDENFVAGPRKHFEAINGKWLTMVDESTLNLTR